jgi:hypothetical protein
MKYESCMHQNRQWEADGVNYLCGDCGTIGQADYFEWKRQQERIEIPMTDLSKIPSKDKCTCTKCELERKDLKIKELEEHLHRFEYLLKQYALRDERPCRSAYHDELDAWEKANQEAGE